RLLPTASRAEFLVPQTSPKAPVAQRWLVQLPVQPPRRAGQAFPAHQVFPVRPRVPYSSSQAPVLGRSGRFPRSERVPRRGCVVIFERLVVSDRGTPIPEDVRDKTTLS